MNRIFLCVLLFMFLTSGLRAQVAYKDAQGRFVIDNSAMPANARKTATEVANTIGADGVVAKHTEKDVMNVKLSPKFEVAAVDESGADVSFSLATAAQFCKNKDGGNQGWRPPTQRELMLFLILKPQMEALDGFAAFTLDIANGHYYTCSTSHSIYTNYIYRLDIKGGMMLTTANWDLNRLRCVRDL